MENKESSLRKQLKQRIKYCSDWKMNDEVHPVDAVYANGKEQAFREVLDFLDKKNFIDEDGMQRKFE